MAREYPEHPRVGVGVVVLKEDHVLLVRRARPPRQGEWSLPGGLQELGETVAEAAHREVREETGVDIEIAGTVAVIDLIEREGSAVRYHYTLIDLAARYRAGEPRAAGDAAEATWAPTDGLDPFGLRTESRRVIAEAVALLAGKQR